MDTSTSQSTAIVAESVSGPLTDKVSKAACGVAAVAWVDAGLADESAGAQAKTAIAVAKGFGISVSIALAKALWGPVAVGDT